MAEKRWPTVEELWLNPEGVGPVDMLGMLPNEEEEDSERKLRLFAVACCRSIWHLLNDTLSRQAVEVVEQFADGQTTLDVIGGLHEAAEKKMRETYPASVTPLPGGGSRLTSKDTALDFYLPSLAETITQNPFYRYMAQDSTDSVGAIAMYSAIGAGQWNTTEMDSICERIAGAQATINCSLLRDIYGNPFRPVTLDAAWQTSTVVALAQSVYDERAFERLPILADALEEAGCTNADLLVHCRQPGEHVRGCWVVDLLLGKT
jgi:hypothetical protein